MRPPGTKCPHDLIQFCPLYAGMHIDNGPSCWPKNNDLEKGCAVDQGASYATLLARFERAHPDIVKERAAAERHHHASEQRDRNLKLNGIH